MKKYVLHENTKHIKTHIDFRGNLNEQQYRVVTEGEGPCLVLAGAGSGKTRTLIYRLAYLLERGEAPHGILLMTFTNKAAREMRDRTEALLGYKPKGLWSGTFHHVGNRSLRMYAPKIGYKRDFGILDEHDSRDLIKACMKKLKLNKREEKFPKPSVVQSIISLSVNTKSPIEDVLDEKYPYFLEFTEEIKGIKDRYGKKKIQTGNMDYDDLLSVWKRLLESVPEAGKRFSEQFKYIMVDEYQDTNFLQSDIIDLLGGRHKNVLVVGDDAQAIYSFRGARVENILRFPKKFNDAKIFKLETNYRSTPEILALANNSLENNKNQFPKKLKAVNPSLDVPALVEVRDLYAQAKFVAQRVNEMVDEGVPISDIAVLFRAHYQSAELEMELVKRGIPYVVRGGIRFFEQAHIKDVLAFLKIMANPADEVAWVRALSLCPGIGTGYAERIYGSFIKSGLEVSQFMQSDITAIVPKKAQDGYSRFLRIMRAVTDTGPEGSAGEMLKLVLNSGYELHVQAAYENAKDRIDDIHELINFSHSYESMTDLLSDITLREGFRGENITGGAGDEEQLVLSTIHQAKGLEWDSVMVIGLSEGQFPHAKAMGGDADMEEERRLFYVAVTRAKRSLYLIHPGMRYDYRMGAMISPTSRFLEELEDKHYELWQTESSFVFNEDEEKVIEL